MNAFICKTQKFYVKERKNNLKSVAYLLILLLTIVFLALTLCFNFSKSYAKEDDKTSYQTQTPKYVAKKQEVRNYANITYYQKKVVQIEEKPEIKMDKVTIPENSGDGWFKSYMDLKMITDKTTDQYYYKQFYECNKDGLYTYNDDYVVAMAETMFKIGDRVQVEFDDGTVINCFVGDLKCKSDENFDGIGHIHYVGDEKHTSIVEFFVDMDRLNEMSTKLGTVNNLISNGNIDSIFIKVPGDEKFANVDISEYN